MWRAQRRGAQTSFIDESGAVVPFADYLELVLNDIEGDAEALDCVEEVQRARSIVAEGTSSDRQLAVFSAAKSDGRTPAQALSAVVDWLADTITR